MASRPPAAAADRPVESLQELLELSPLAAVAVGEDGAILLANDLLAELLGWERDMLTGQPLETLIPERFHAAHASHFDRYLQAPELRPLSAGHELWACRKDGSELPVDIGLRPLTRDGSTVVIATLRDLTVSHQAMEDLRRSERRFRIAAGHTSDMIQEVDLPADRITYFGDIDGHFGYEAGDFPRTVSGVADYIHPDDLSTWDSELERTLAPGAKSWQMQYRLRAADGTYRHILDRGSYTSFLDDGRPSHGVGAFQDITDQVLKERQLQEALADATEQAVLNLAILDSLSSRVAVLDGAGQIVAINKAWTDFALANPAETAARIAVGDNYLEACRRAAHGDQFAVRALQGISSVLDGSAETFRMEYPCHTPADERWFAMSVVPLQTEQGGAVAAHTDVTLLALRQRELERALAEVATLRDRLADENVYLREELREELAYGEIIGNSESWRHVLAQVRLVAGTDSTVLLTGETGTGKELLAHAVHAESSRSDQPLIKINCAALPSTLIESELFGHEKGAFSGADRRRKGRFELADRGTLLLDEVGELPLELQAKLLHVLQTGEFERLGSETTLRCDVRVIAATNRDLGAEVEAGRFRSDLYYRVAVFPIEVPPLRRRREDIRLLAMYFLAQQNARHGKSIESIPRATMTALEEYDWPGNVRELENVIERAVILSRGSTLALDPASLRAVEASPRRGSRDPAARPVPLKRAGPVASANLEEVERAHIVRVLESCGWKVRGRGNAAEQLGLNESTLRSRMKRLGITRP